MILCICKVNLCISQRFGSSTMVVRYVPDTTHTNPRFESRLSTCWYTTSKTGLRTSPVQDSGLRNQSSFQSLVFWQISRSETGRSPLTSPHYVGRQRIAQLVELPAYRGVMGSSPIALFAVCRWTGAGNSKSSTEYSVAYMDSSMYVRKCRYENLIILQGYRGSYVKGERTSMV